MSEAEVTGGDSAAQETIAQLNAELERLRRELATETAGRELRRALSLAATAGTIASPITHTRLLEMIVETAAQVISAQAASLFLIDTETNELIFEVALGQKAEEVKRFRVPVGHGIAGLVAMTGQPMSVSDAQQDPRQAAEIAQSVGYTPRSILCVPLFYDEQVIGVLELLDKIGAPSFSPSDTASLGLFANMAAVAIEQSRANRNLAALVGETLRSLGGQDEGALQAELRSFITSMEEDVAYRRALDLAQLVHEIAWQGEREVTLCRSVLGAFAEYARTKPGGSLSDMIRSLGTL
jgi:GAF domain-containing protein